MKNNLLSATAASLVAYIINVIIYGSLINALGAFIATFLLCLALFTLIDWIGL